MTMTLLTWPNSMTIKPTHLTTHDDRDPANLTTHDDHDPSNLATHDDHNSAHLTTHDDRDPAHLTSHDDHDPAHLCMLELFLPLPDERLICQGDTATLTPAPQ